MQIVNYDCTPANIDKMVAKFMANTDLWQGDGVWSLNGRLQVPPGSRLVRPAAAPGHYRTFDDRMTHALRSAWGSEAKDLGTVTAVWEVWST